MRVPVSEVRHLVGHPMKEIQLAMIDAALEQTKGNVVAAAALLGISGRTIYRKINRYIDEGSPR